MCDIQDVENRLNALTKRLSALEGLVAEMDAALCGYDPDERIGITEAGLAALSQADDAVEWPELCVICGDVATRCVKVQTIPGSFDTKFFWLDMCESCADGHHEMQLRAWDATESPGLEIPF